MISGSLVMLEAMILSGVATASLLLVREIRNQR